MPLDCPYLDLTPHWAYEVDRANMLVVRGLDARRLCANGDFRAVDSSQAIKALKRMSKSLEREISDFLYETTIGLAGGRARSRQQLVNEVADYLRQKIYVALRRVGSEVGRYNPSVEERRLIRDIEGGTRGWLWEGGRKHKLVAGADLDGVPGRASYEVVPHEEAAKVLEALAGQFAGKGDVAKKLVEARTKLSPDWRSPGCPTGIVLLRKSVVPRAASVQPGPALTPSQLKALQEKPAYQFVWDQPWSQRQWVNLPRSWGVVGFGDTATLSGHVEPREAGQVVTFTLLPDPSNPAEATGAALESTTVTSDAQGKVQVEMAFPIHPGAKFKVAGKTASMAAPVESEPITVWRRVYYQITVMDPAPDGRRFDPPADMISALEGALNPVWIELAPGTKSTATTPYKAHLTWAERNAVENSLRPSSVDNRSPYKMNIVMVDSADIVAEADWYEWSAGPTVETKPVWLWPHEPTVIKALYRPSPGVWVPMTDVQVLPAGQGMVKVRASMAGPQPAPVLFRLHFRYQRSKGGGWGGTTGTVFICIGLMRRHGCNPDGAYLQPTLTHEIGHALGLVPKTASWHDPDKRDAEYSLRHCGNMTAAHEPTCVMWWEGGGAGVRTQFCNANAPNNCKHFLLRADLSTIRWI